MWKLEEDETKNIKIAAVEAKLGDRLNHNHKLKVMKFEVAVNGPDSDKWKEEIESEHTRMMSNGIRRKAKISIKVDLMLGDFSRFQGSILI